MIRVPKEYRKQADFATYFIIMIAIILIVIIYAEKISGLIAWIISIVFPFILGIGLAFVFNIIANALLDLVNRFYKIKKTKIQVLIANILSICLVVYLVVGIFMTIIPQVAVSVNALISNAPDLFYNFRNLLLKWSETIPALESVANSLDIHSIEHSQILSNIESLSDIFLGSSQLVNQVNGIISATISWVTTFALSLAFSIFVLLNKTQFLSDIQTLSKGFLPKKGYRNAVHIYKVFTDTFKHYIGGTLLECLILGTLVGLGCTLLSIPYAILIGFVVAIGAIVPMFGALISAIICFLFLVLEGNSSAAITFIVMFILIQQIEGNFIYPNVVGKSIGLPPMYVIVAVTLGASFGGILGMIVFIPLMGSLYILAMESANKRIQQKNFKST